MPSIEVSEGGAASSGTAVMTVTADRLAASRSLSRRMAQRYGLSPEREQDLTLAVDEVVTNAIEHGAGVAYQRIWHEGDTLVCEVTDQGTGIQDLPAALAPPELDALRGRGLWLAQQLCDRVAIDPGPAGCTVRLHLTI